MDYMIDEFTENTEISNMPKICASESLWLDLIEVCILYFINFYVFNNTN